MASPQRGDRSEIEAEAAPGKSALFSGGKMSNFQARLITAVIAALFTLAITCCGGRAFVLFCLCVGAAVLFEWNAIVKIYAAKSAAVCVWLFYGLFGLALLASPAAAPGQAAVFAVLSAGLAVAAAAAWRAGGGKAAICMAGGLLYAALFPLSFACLRAGGGNAGALSAAAPAQIGLYWALLLYIIVWASDVGAYLFGRSFGGPKLAPKISPNKTWSGAGGGLLCAVLAALCYAFFAEGHFAAAGAPAGLARHSIFSPPLVIFIALLLSLVSQAGDLLESRFKRLFGVKDSGRLLPGHGGIMDRVDGLLPACAVFAFFLSVFYY